jgi:hypothetical protein
MPDENGAAISEDYKSRHAEQKRSGKYNCYGCSYDVKYSLPGTTDRLV